MEEFNVSEEWRAKLQEAASFDYGFSCEGHEGYRLSHGDGYRFARNAACEGEATIRVLPYAMCPMTLQLRCGHYECECGPVEAKAAICAVRSVRPVYASSALCRRTGMAEIDAMFELLFAGKCPEAKYKPVSDKMDELGLPRQLGKPFAATVAKGLDFTDEGETTVTFRGAKWFEAAQGDATLIGAGGIGSWLAVPLARMLGSGRLDVYDPDRVELRNLCGQAFGVGDIGKYKPEAVKDAVSGMSGNCKVYPHWAPFGEGTYVAGGAVFSCVDSMSSRKAVYGALKGCFKGLLVDGRLSAEKWQCLCVDFSDERAVMEYESKWLFPDGEAEQGACTYKQTTYSAMALASAMCNCYANWCANKSGGIKRRVPFLVEYDAANFLTRIQDYE